MKNSFLSQRDFVISGGIPRSGSTLLFNILRELMYVQYGDNFISLWEGDLHQVDGDLPLLIKTHRMLPIYRLYARETFFSYRDIRTAIVSAKRAFNYEINMQHIRSFVREYFVAQAHGAFMVRYEHLLDWPAYTILNISERLGSPHIDPYQIHQKALHLMKSKAHNPITLLHPEHITQTGDNDWREVIPAELQKQINHEFAWWFEECKYPLC